ncbi:hypothetical protein J4T99_gp077 [Mycobacterium phage Bromden]|uniref:Uncharacterized protein n=1 Tax=Mycobacterium phage Bromden TaxID=2283252 RepID=A0A345MBL1_9CAUD|nr:hypothetical protein J4T99_gp077 [Mycobacterium phage Bromden]AXH67882.1 hypothetical protein SEA_BROMDEN_77 [Mycobacterium phage Bromden]
MRWTNWSDPESVRKVGLSGAHSRVARLWGRAADYDCYVCGGVAAQWAYDGSDPSQLLGVKDTSNTVPMWYSAYPEFYAPMCFKCHKLKDRALMYRELTEYRQAKVRS